MSFLLIMPPRLHQFLADSEKWKWTFIRAVISTLQYLQFFRPSDPLKLLTDSKDSGAGSLIGKCSRLSQEAHRNYDDLGSIITTCTPNGAMTRFPKSEHGYDAFLNKSKSDL